MPKLKNNQRALLLVIDGLGIGEMPDVKKTRKKDIGAFTLKNVLKGKNINLLKNFIQTGLGNINERAGLPKIKNPKMSYGKNKLAHFGADTFWGHQEIVGTKPKMPTRQHIIALADDLKRALEEKKHKVKFWKNNKSILIVDDYVVIGDNLEADPGWVISVTGCLDYMPFEKIVEIGKIVRSIVKTSRVNIHGGKYVNLDGLLIGVEKRKDDKGKEYIGHNVPKTGIYPSDHFRQVQLGYGVDPSTQITTILIKNNYPVALIGKAGDVITCQGAKYNNMVQTDKVLELIFKFLKEQRNGLIMANVQETDLSGHAQKPDEYFKRLVMINKALPKIIKMLKKDNLFIITGDHGNDPTIGHPNHTREYTPLLVLQKGNRKITNLGIRKTLSDIGATIANYFEVSFPENGKSFLEKII